MQLHTGTWGHVGLPFPPTAAMEEAEEACETAMLRARYARKSMRGAHTMIGCILPVTRDVIFNPNTLADLQSILLAY